MARHDRPPHRRLRVHVRRGRRAVGPGSPRRAPGRGRIRTRELHRHRAAGAAMRLWLGLALVAAPVAAQSAQARLEGRVPGAAIPVLDSLVERALAEGLPTEPLIQKALEGGAKQVTAPRTVAAVQASFGPTRGAAARARRPVDATPP